MTFELFDPAVVRLFVGLVAVVALVGLVGVATLAAPGVRTLARHRTTRRSRRQSLRDYYGHVTHAH
ncbi:hypothetical protein EKO23_00795 [Nocardioides guangzhouensis]|uniref:Uncharacterized protein n=1 Tax=Nocardioides guangzhouensis TaxID=2497878 RepID=A0A4Q4ZKX2_9ACTN|nr:hypothetical protein [Nocardioides guangzhouensis]RYP89003.1 hypothetical protein EKO23_00795 [Nocardioides guangzhouensis]